MKSMNREYDYENEKSVANQKLFVTSNQFYSLPIAKAIESGTRHPTISSFMSGVAFIHNLYRMFWIQ